MQQNPVVTSVFLGMNKTGIALQGGSLPVVQPKLYQSPVQFLETTSGAITARLSGVTEKIALDQVTRIEQGNPTTTYGTLTGASCERNQLGEITKKIFLRPSSWDMPLLILNNVGTVSPRISFFSMIQASLKLSVSTTAVPTLTPGKVFAHVVAGANAGWTETGASWNFRDGTNAWAGGVGMQQYETDYMTARLGEFEVRRGLDSSSQTFYVPLDLTQLWLAMTLGGGFILQHERVPAKWTANLTLSTDDVGDTTLAPWLDVTRRFNSLDTNFISGAIDYATPQTQSIWIHVANDPCYISFGESSTPSSLTSLVLEPGYNFFNYSSLSSPVVKIRTGASSKVHWFFVDEA